MTTTTEKKTITITMSERRPLKIDPAQWPVVARADWYNGGQHECQANTIREIKVREHADGRRIVYGYQEAGNGGQFAGTVNPRAGFLVPPVDRATMRERSDTKLMTAAYPDDDETVRAIRRVGGIIEDDQLAADCIAALPAEEI